MDLVTLHARTVQVWLGYVDGVQENQWDAATPCTDWTVRDLVNHVVGEDLWTVPLLEGSTIEEVGDRFEGDVLGSDPIGVARDSGRAAADATASAVPGGGTVRLSYGEDSVDNYVGQLAADHLVHAWDLAVATGQDAELDEDLVSAVAAWYAPWESAYRAGGAVGARSDTSNNPQDDLILGFGRDPRWHA
ncbi:MAG: TIGR03086 family metal-binding protein [Nocardioidaceae bacterium]